MVSLVALGAVYLLVTLAPCLGSVWAGMDRRDPAAPVTASVSR